MRVVKYYQRYINITHISLEDVSFDIRAIAEGKKLSGKEYQVSNRLDDNLRRAVYARDKGTCQMCGCKNNGKADDKTDNKKEAHHITPKRKGGPDSIYNLILLCPECHDKVTGKEELYADEFYKKIDGKLVQTALTQHVMIGKTYLREELSKLGKLSLTTGGDTGNKRKAWNIDKSHCNDAVVIACNKLKPDRLDVVDYIIKPIRHKKKATTTSMGFKLGDYVELTIRSNKLKKIIKVKGFITAFIAGQSGKNKGKLINVNITTIDGTEYKRYTLSKCRLLYRPKTLNFMKME